MDCVDKDVFPKLSRKFGSFKICLALFMLVLVTGLNVDGE